MFFCKSCGTQIENDDAKFCPKCGTATTPNAQQWAPDYATEPAEKPLTMKWYKWLIYFVLFAGALINLVQGYGLISGDIYFSQSNGEITAEEVYEVIGEGLKTIDTVYGIALIAIAAFGIYTRFRLSKFKANAPMCVCILYGAGVVASLIYTIAASTMIEGAFGSDTITSLIFPAIMIWANYTYFNKRKHLFVN